MKGKDWWDLLLFIVIAGELCAALWADWHDHDQQFIMHSVRACVLMLLRLQGK